MKGTKWVCSWKFAPSSWKGTSHNIDGTNMSKCKFRENLKSFFQVEAVISSHSQNVFYSNNIFRRNRERQNRVPFIFPDALDEQNDDDDDDDDEDEGAPPLGGEAHGPPKTRPNDPPSHSIPSGSHPLTRRKVPRPLLTTALIFIISAFFSSAKFSRKNGIIFERFTSPKWKEWNGMMI